MRGALHVSFSVSGKTFSIVHVYSFYAQSMKAAYGFFLGQSRSFFGLAKENPATGHRPG